MRRLILFLILSSAIHAQVLRPVMAGYIPGTPTDSPGAGSYGSTQSVTLTDATASTIFYTTSGTGPDCLGINGTHYTGAISVSVTTTVKAIGCNGITGGGVLTSVYTITAGGFVLQHTFSAFSTGTTVTHPAPLNVTVSGGTIGNLYAVFTSNRSNSVDGVTDDASPPNTYAALTQWGTLNSMTGQWYWTILAHVPTTVSITVDGVGSDYTTGNVLEYSGNASSSPADQDQGSTPAAAPRTSGSFNPTQAGELGLVAYVTLDPGVTPAVSGYTLQLMNGQSGYIPGIYDNTSLSTGSQTVTGTAGFSDTSFLAVATFKHP